MTSYFPEDPVSERLRTLADDLRQMARRRCHITPDCLRQIAAVVEDAAADAADIEVDMRVSAPVDERPVKFINRQIARMEDVLSGKVVAFPVQPRVNRQPPPTGGDAA